MTKTLEDASERPEKRSGMIQSVSMAAGFLKTLANATGALPLGELARLNNVGRSTAHRYLQSLAREGLAKQDPETGFYDLGAEALYIGAGALRRVEPIEVAAKAMKSLAQSKTISCGVAIWTDRGPTLVRWYRSAYFSINPLALGDVLPIDNTACGLVFQAHLAPDIVELARQNQPDFYRGTPPTAETLTRIRSEGRAELTSHLLSNITGQATPVFDAQGEIACVMTTITDLGRLQDPSDRTLLFEESLRVNHTTGGAQV